MAFCNSFSPPTTPSLSEEELYGPEPYDVNFNLPLNFAALENERVKLTPFVPRTHARALFDVLTEHSELFRYLPFETPKTFLALLAFVEHGFRRNPTFVLLAIVDKTGSESGTFAGLIAYIYASPQDLSVEIGAVIIFPAFQRTHVQSNATGLLLQHALNLPTQSPPGIGLRRVQWTANTRNIASIRAAERSGFRREGTVRWIFVLPEGHEGNEPREGDSYPNKMGRDSAVLGVTWEDWESGTREKVQAVMERKS